MSDTLGRISVPGPPAPSGQTWPLVTDYPAALDWDWPVVSHRFQELATLGVQRFQSSIGNRHFHFRKGALTFTERASLITFFNNCQGAYKSFIYPAPNSDRATFTNFTVIFDQPPISIDQLASMCRTGLTFIETDPDPGSTPSYSVSSTVQYPFTSALTALADQVQILIPLIHIRVRNTAVPDIYLSDRRATIGGQLYLPRVLGIGDPSSDILMSQSISGAADNVQFSFGNADRAMSDLVRDCSLDHAVLDLCFYHVSSQKLIQLWKGIITSWSSDGGPAFSVQCSDGLYPITQAYPRRVASRQCWKPFNKEIYPGYKPCPYSTAHTTDTSLDVTKCDYFFNTPNGCLAHGMSPYFGGHPAFPQSVVIKDNGTGVLNFGRSTVTSTSIVADNFVGRPLPEIWCNDDGDPRKAFWANAIVVAVRDESDFEDVLGIVGAGPLGSYEGMSVQTNADGFKFIVSPLADGFPPQGFKLDSQLQITGYQPTYGLREILGTDPASPSTDPFSLGQGTPQRWDVPDPQFSNILTGAYNNIIPLAAGTAFVELRYQKSTNGGISPTRAETHSMSVPIARGLTGFTFGSSGVRSSVSGLTNNFWVALNTYFRALGIDRADASTQLSSFVLPALIDGAGNGCAEIADLVVPVIVGSGTERQFRFQGAIIESKPFRDWLVEILSSCLGYFTFEFGRLRLGIRENASASISFTPGNMLYQSLALTPISPAFEYLKLSFASQALQGQEDFAEYEDKDHEDYYGRLGAPLTSSMRSVGLSTLSQALRVAATRVREEIGGVLRPDLANPYLEWDNNLRATWKSTILALDTSVGSVVSVTHPDLATYPGLSANTWKFRVERLTLHRDWSVTFTGRSVTDSMYDLDVGPKPADLTPKPLPALFFAIPLGPAWAPWQVAANASDPLFPSEYNFDVDIEYTTLADGSASSQALCTGKLPVNTFAPGIGTPTIGSITQSSTGGSLPGGTSYRLTLVVFTSTGGLPSPPAEIALVHIPAGTNTNKITLNNIVWPKVTGLYSYGLFLSGKDTLINLWESIVLTPTGDGTTYTPTTISITAPVADRRSWALPSPYISRLRVKAKLVAHGGVAGMGVDSVSANTLVLSALIDLTGSPFNPVGRVVSVIGRPTGPTPFASYLITAFDLTTGTATVTPDPAGVVLPGDAAVVRCLGYDNSATPTVFTDPGFLNSTNAHAGLTTDAEKGRLVRVISGLGRGELRKIVSNTSASLTWDLPLALDTTSVLIIEEPEYTSSVDSADFSNSDSSVPVTIGVPMDNYINQPILLAGFTVDLNGVESAEGDGPVRENYIFGNPGTTGDPIIAYI